MNKSFICFLEIIFLYYSCFHQFELLPSDRRLVHSRSILHRCVVINDYSKFLLHVTEFQVTIWTKYYNLTFFDDLLLWFIVNCDCNNNNHNSDYSALALLFNYIFIIKHYLDLSLASFCKSFCGTSIAQFMRAIRTCLSPKMKLYQ